MIQVTFMGLLELYNTSSLLFLIFHTVLIMCLNLCILLLLCIYKWLIVSYYMSNKLLIKVSTLLQTSHLIFLPSLMQIRQVVLPLDALPLVIVSMLAEILSHGVQRNNQQFLAPTLKLNIRSWQTMKWNSHGLPFS